MTRSQLAFFAERSSNAALKSRLTTAATLALTLGACTRAVSPVEGPPPDDCVWQAAARIDDAPLLAEDTQFVAATEGDGTATLLVPVESAEADYGYWQYRVDARMHVVSRTYTHGFFPRAARLDGGVLSMVALDTDSGDCVYREIDASGTEARRQILLTAQIQQCIVPRLAINATHVLHTFGEGTFDKDNIEMWRRSDFARAVLGDEDSWFGGPFTTPVDGGFSMAAARDSENVVERYRISEDSVTIDELPIMRRPGAFIHRRALMSAHGDAVVYELDFEVLSHSFQVVGDRVSSKISLSDYGTRDFFPVSTNATISVAAVEETPGSHLAVWTHYRATGEESLVTLDERATHGDFTAVTASSARQGYVFWLREGEIYGSVMRCE
jgi:hypothetical protein